MSSPGGVGQQAPVRQLGGLEELCELPQRGGTTGPSPPVRGSGGTL